MDVYNYVRRCSHKKNSNVGTFGGVTPNEVNPQGCGLFFIPFYDIFYTFPIFLGNIQWAQNVYSVITEKKATSTYVLGCRWDRKAPFSAFNATCAGLFPDTVQYQVLTTFVLSDAGLQS